MNVIPTFFSDEECDRWIAFIDEKDVDRPHMDYKTNVHLKELVELIGKKLNRTVHEVTTLIKYRENSQGIGKHLDLIREEGICESGIVYLNSNRGDTVLYIEGSEPVSITPRKGSALIFDVRIPHEGLPPRGVKYIITFKLMR